MPILVMCTNPACGELFDAPDSAAGNEVRCPSCGTAQRLPASPSAPALKEPPSTAAPAPAPKEPSAPAPKELPAGPAGGTAEKRTTEPKPTDGVPSAPVPPVRVPSPDKSPAPLELDFSVAPAPPAAGSAAKKPTAGVKPTEGAPSESEIEFDLTPLTTKVPYSTSPPPGSPKQRTSAGGPVAPGRFVPAGSAPHSQAPRSAEQRPPGASAGSPAQSPGKPPAATTEQGQEPGALDAIWNAPPAVDAQSEADGTPVAGDGVLSHKPSAALVLVLGFVGLAVGLAIGLKVFPEQWLLAAYIGAGLGWTAGFAFGALLVLGTEQGSAKLRCSVCHNDYPPGTEECAACGSTSLAPAPDPLATECFYAGSFALSNPVNLLPPVLLAVLGELIVSICVQLLRAYPKQTDQWLPALVGLCVLVSYLVISYWAAFLLSAAELPAARANLSRKAPDAPALGSLNTLLAGIWGLGVLVVYVVPLVTIPLLPLAMLMLSSSGRRKQATNPILAAKAAWRHAKGFVVLWMFLLMWLAGLALAATVVYFLYGLRTAISPGEGFSAILLSSLLSAFATGAFAVAAAIFGLALFRCIGAFGRFNPGALWGGRG